MADAVDGDRRLASGKSAAKNRLAQQRYRQRKKDQFRDAQQEIQELQQRLAELEVRAQALDERNRFLEQSVSSPTASGQEAGPSDRQSWQSPGTPAALARLLNGTRRGGGAVVTEADAAKLMPSDLAGLRHEYVSNLALLLMKADQPGSAAAQELDAYVHSQRTNWMAMIEGLSESSMRALILDRLRAPVQVFKLTLVRALALTPAQKQALLALRRRSKLELQEVERERTEAAALLAKSAGEHRPAHPWRHAEFFDRVSASDKLRHSLAVERRSFGALKRGCWEIITPVQEARALVEGFPDAVMDVQILTEYLEAEAEGREQEWLAAHEGKTYLSLPQQQQAQQQAQQQQQQQPLQAPAEALSGPSSSHQSNPGQPFAAPLLDACTARADSSNLSEEAPSLGPDPLNAFPAIPPELLNGYEAREADQWMELLEASGPGMEFRML